MTTARGAAGDAQSAAPIVVADTVTMLDATHRGGVLVTGSHGGIIAAYLAARGGVRAAIFNDAGGGVDNAGFAGLDWLAALGMAAATVAHTSARIADAGDTLVCGIVSHANRFAAEAGVAAGMRCADAANALRHVAPRQREPMPYVEARTLLRAADETLPEVRGLDSIGLVAADDAGRVLIVGSHGGLHGGHPETALPVAAMAAVFHDAGRGKDGAWCTRLPVLAARGIAAATVDYRTARIGDAQSLWNTGVLSSVNTIAQSRGWHVGDAVQEAIARLARSSP